jgi:hypothetical protein
VADYCKNYHLILEYTNPGQNFTSRQTITISYDPNDISKNSMSLPKTIHNEQHVHSSSDQTVCGKVQTSYNKQQQKIDRKISNPIKTVYFQI